MIKHLNPLTTLSAAVVSAAVVSIATPARAFTPVTFGYQCITTPVTSNVATNCAIAESQITTTISSYNNNPSQVLFTFNNVGLAAASITDVYFQDTIPKTLLSFAQIINSTGVSFSIGASPANLPGGNSIDPKFVADFGADSNSPTQPNGVNPSETLGIVFNILPGYDINGVLEDLRIGSLRIGLHIQGFQNGGSVSIINEEVPEPLTILGSAVALVGGAALKRRASRKTSQEKSAVI